ncbi:PREDICTED: neuroligin-2-like isoform X2 [Dinoponera quadriceps]|uniref:Neuroligin-2-like isoform X2 n=1 Tax=Dinoponera quadriceps TaxID=609295 RepID=A0A6P3XJV4_DINQU|nr:PREDICTED: neuroligin-2-like isoform X2 [Dinoponera quadriceps]
MLLPCQPAARSRPLVARTPIGPKRPACRSCVGLALLIALLSLTGDGRAASQPTTRYASRIVETKSGQIRGILQELNSRHLDPVEVFRGIPYAAPPVGDLRFRAPISPIPWNSVKLADTFGAVCPQNYPDIANDTAALLQMPLGRYQQLKKMIAFLTNQSEDCLFLNLYIPGSGFLRTRPFPDRTSGSGGNLALKDITMALRWVRENIGAFGGDPTRITIMGHDTGAALVNLLLLAPYSKGLFHRVVLSSGSALSPWASVHDPNDLRTKIGEQIGCSTEGDEDIADCLRGVPLEALMDVQLPEIRFVPRVGPGLPVDQNNPDPGMDMERASDAFIKVPLILGVSTTESNLDFNANDIQFGFEEDHRNRILRTFIRNAYVYHLNEIFSAVRNEYTDWDKPVLHPIIIRDSTMEALSDGHTVAPLMRIAFYHARRGAKTYFYHFNHQSKDSGYLQRLGSVRGEDIPYIFGLPLVAGGAFFPRNYSRQDQGVAEAVLTFFTNFAKTGNPNEPHKIESVDYGTPKEKTRFRGLTWEQYETGSQQYLTIALKPKMKSHYRGHKMAVWLNLIPQLHRPGDDDVSMRHHHFRERGDHYYAGPVRDEWYTPLPLTGTTRTSASSTTACSTSTGDESLAEDITPILDDSEDDAELLQRLASRHYYSTTTALAITVGVGCVLLVLNMLIFAGIYYQRDRDKKRAAMDCRPNGQESLPLTTRSSIKSAENPKPAQEPPPSYTTLARSPSLQEQQQQFAQEVQDNGEQSRKEMRHGTTIHKDPVPPKPPARTTSSLSTSNTTNTIKKRVQIQEISV